MAVEVWFPVTVAGPRRSFTGFPFFRRGRTPREFCRKTLYGCPLTAQEGWGRISSALAFNKGKRGFGGVSLIPQE